MRKQERITKENILWVYIAASAFAVIFFVLLYGIEVLLPTNVNWLYGIFEIKEGIFGGRDLAQHYMGWVGYRQSNWTFPIGNFNALSYPFQKSIIFTDSIPLLAVFFKLFRGILPTDFQYFGIWGLFCFIMQGIMSIRLLRHFINDKRILFIASLFFVTMPTFLWRMFIHTALDSQWLILMALEPLFVPNEFDKKKLIKHFSVVGVLCASIHIYLLFYCGIILTGVCLYSFINKEKFVNIVSYILSYIGFSAAIIFLLGGFDSGITAGATGLRLYSMNLNSFFESYGLSTFIPEFSKYHSLESANLTQNEGYAYLGLGILCLLVIGLYLVVVNMLQKVSFVNDKLRIISILFVFLMAFIIAVSPRITFAQYVICDLPLPAFVENLMNTFRATGRAAWIVVDVLVFLLIILLNKFVKNKVLFIVFILCFALQIFDNYKLYEVVHNYFYNEKQQFLSADNISDSRFWDVVRDNDNIKHIVMANTSYPYDDEYCYLFYDAFPIGIDQANFQKMQYFGGDFANKNGLTFNYFRFSRHFYADSRKNYYELLSKENLDEYIFLYNEYNIMNAVNFPGNVYKVDDWYVAYSGDLDNNYLIDKFDLKIDYAFDQYDLIIQPGSTSLVACMELPRGKYVVKASCNDNENIILSYVDGDGEIYNCVGEGLVTGQYVMFELSLEDDLYQAGQLITNVGNSPISVYSLEVTPIL